MSFDIPDQGEGLSDIQSILFQEDLDVAINDVPLGLYVKSGLVVTAQGVPNMTVAVSAGVAYSTTRLPVAPMASLAIGAADATNPRLDMVVVTIAGVLAIRAGTPIAFTTTTTPKPPILTLGDVAIAQIYVPAATTTIATANIKGRSYLLPNLAWAQTEVGTYDNYLNIFPVSGTTALSASGGAPVTMTAPTSHPTPAAGRITQLWRAQCANVVTTTNQVLGWIYNSAALHKFWRGSAANQGGFYFRGKMTIDLFVATGCRYFQGMSSVGAGVSASDTLTGDICGLWHDSTMANTVLNFITRDNVTTTSVAITLAAPMAAGQGYELIMYCKPNDTILYYKVVDMLTGNTLADSFTSTTLPRNTIFMSPQQNMSNGTANITATTVAPGIVECEVKSPAIRT